MTTQHQGSKKKEAQKIIKRKHKKEQFKRVKISYNFAGRTDA